MKNITKETYLKTAKWLLEKKKTKKKNNLLFHPYMSDTQSFSAKTLEQIQNHFINKTGMNEWKIL